MEESSTITLEPKLDDIADICKNIDPRDEAIHKTIRYNGQNVVTDLVLNMTFYSETYGKDVTADLVMKVDDLVETYNSHKDDVDVRRSVSKFLTFISDFILCSNANRSTQLVPIRDLALSLSLARDRLKPVPLKEKVISG
ncbi:hypothetical protein ACFL0U_00950 [Pseudomonadota bacterium]